MKTSPRPKQAQRQSAPRWVALAVRPLLLSLVALSLLAGISGGLLRAGVALPLPTDSAWPSQAALMHAALMICGFLGTVIGIERAVAVKLRSAFLAPLASGAGGALLLLGQPRPGAWMGVVAAAIFTAVNIVIVRRQRAAHTWLLLVAAGAWLAGNLLFATGQDSVATLPWWFAFLVMTIAAERLEMTRLMRRRPAAELSLQAVLGALIAGAAWSALAPVAGGLLYGAALALLALWLAAFDIARHTVRAHGLSRYMAVCLLGGYAWLAVAGVAWAGTAIGLPLRDAALHALGLGFIVSMMMGHAPVILPAIARVKLRFGVFFYVPLAVLHLSLLLRLVAGMAGNPLHSTGALLNAVAMALFAATIAGAAIAWRIQHGGPDALSTRKTSS
ncbi:MAG TPA: hypothetical protein VE934_14570 [Polaromonas sp.]|uniref:hypothetical protein n=1 Tax=Polaromonas sp. TaxID=1869339 RepID=UPI002D29540B|nr:hypothetical protein [Polaromonas sp.]HYW58176.1 hypothetical protein [Polaromonas sp.]